MQMFVHCVQCQFCCAGGWTGSRAQINSQTKWLFSARTRKRTVCKRHSCGGVFFVKEASVSAFEAADRQCCCRVFFCSSVSLSCQASCVQAGVKSFQRVGALSFINVLIVTHSSLDSSISLKSFLVPLRTAIFACLGMKCPLVSRNRISWWSTFFRAHLDVCWHTLTCPRVFTVTNSQHKFVDRRAHEQVDVVGEDVDFEADADVH